MAKKKRPKGLDEHIAELEAVVGEIDTCPACGKGIESNAVTCPHCGTPVHEAAELQAKAAESLEDLSKQLAETSGPEPDAPPPSGGSRARPVETDDGGLASAAALAEVVEEPESDASMDAGPAQEEAVVPEPEAEPGEAESHDLEGFIAQIEEEVGEEVPAPPRVAPVSQPTVHAVHRTEAAPKVSPRRWVTAVAAGAVLYILSVFLLALLGKFIVSSVMVVGTVLMFAGINGRRGPSREVPAPSAGAMHASEYVCPLCGTEIGANATECPTCGAVFVA